MLGLIEALTNDLFASKKMHRCLVSVEVQSGINWPTDSRLDTKCDVALSQPTQKCCGRISIVKMLNADDCIVQSLIRLV